MTIPNSVIFFLFFPRNATSSKIQFSFFLFFLFFLRLLREERLDVDEGVLARVRVDVARFAVRLARVGEVRRQRGVVEGDGVEVARRRLGADLKRQVVRTDVAVVLLQKIGEARPI